MSCQPPNYLPPPQHNTAERPAAPGDGSLTALQGDLLKLDRLLPPETHAGTFALAVCMGDTLTHLQVRTSGMVCTEFGSVQSDYLSVFAFHTHSPWRRSAPSSSRPLTSSAREARSSVS